MIKKERAKLMCLDDVFLHNLRLKSLLKMYCSSFYEVDHHLKHSLSKNRGFIEDGYILWIGHIEYLPALMQSLDNIELGYPLKVLTDLENITSRLKFLKSNIINPNIQQHDSDWYLNGYKLQQWTAERQEQYMASCKGAFDAKSDSFAYAKKPPTKAQQYIYNRIPFAMDLCSYSAEYFEKRGLVIPNLTQLTKWHSKEYFDEISNFVDENQGTQSIEYVSINYLKYITQTKKTLTPYFLTSYLINSWAQTICLAERLLEKTYARFKIYN
jgi:hypothetical protein